VDVCELARIFGISSDVVYRRADELGAIHIGSRLVFDPVDVANRMRRQPADPPAKTTTTSTRRRRRATAPTAELLPIKGQR
jgi:hypothetical protein